MQATGACGDPNTADLAALGPHNYEAQTAERLAVVGLERLGARRVAVVDGGDLAGAFNLELHQVVGTGDRVRSLSSMRTVMNDRSPRRQR